MICEITGSGAAVFQLPLPAPFGRPGKNLLLRIMPLACGAVRITRTMRAEFLSAESSVVLPQISSACKVTETAEDYLADCGNIILHIGKKHGNITFQIRDGELLLREDEKHPCVLAEKPVILHRFHQNGKITYTQSVDGIRASGTDFETLEDRTAYECKLSFTFDGTEGLYGLGSHEEGYGNLRGRSRELYQHNLKAVVPMLLSTRGWGILFDLGCLMTFHDDANGSYLWADCADEMDYYFLWGGYKSVCRQYASLTGKAPMLPKYAFGYIQSKERYKDAEELLSIVQEYRRRQVPLDVIVEDWQSWPEGQWGWKIFDPQRFPDPQLLTDSLHRMGARFMISIWPSMQGEQNENRREMLENNCMLGNRTIYNAFDAKARMLYWKQAREGLFRYGVDAWWCDCSEPFESDWHGRIKPEPFERVRLNTEEAKKYLDPGKINLYSLYHSMGIYQGQRETTDEKRVLNLTRSSYAGQHRYATITWSGDTSSSWETLRRQIPEGLNFMSTGEGWWTTDAGAFFPMDFGGAWFGTGEFPQGVRDPGYRELFVRWMQFSAFLPMMRAHGTGTPREIWQFGDKGEKWYDALEKIICLRSRLVPHFYSLAAEYCQTGVPQVRVPALVFPSDPHLRQVDSEMMVGDTLLVRPVTHPMEYLPEGRKINPVDDTETVYLPAGTIWYRWDENEVYPGGQEITIHAPLDTIPVFIRAGGIVITGPVRQYVSENPQAALQITVCPGQDGSFVWYDDAGDGYGYEKGEFSRVFLSWNDMKKELTLSAREGSYPGMPAQLKMILHVPGKNDISFVYDGSECNVQAE